MPQLYIYIVEDDLLIAAALKRMLLSFGHKVCGIADSYDKAIFDLERIEVDLIISDIMLAGKQTGIDLGKYINQHLNIPFIYHSSTVEDETVKQAWDNLPGGYLIKPVSKTSLETAINKCIKSNSLCPNKNLPGFAKRLEFKHNYN